MRIMIVNTDHGPFLSGFYARRPGLERSSFDEQMRARMQTSFGVADFYFSCLRELGNQAIDVHYNTSHAQRASAQENGVDPGQEWTYRVRLRPPFIRRVRCRHGARLILEAQIAHYQPDVVLNQAMDTVTATVFQTVRPHFGLLVGTVTEPIVEAATRLLTDPSAYAAMAQVRSPFGDGTAARQILDHLQLLLSR